MPTKKKPYKTEYRVWGFDHVGTEVDEHFNNIDMANILYTRLAKQGAVSLTFDQYGYWTKREYEYGAFSEDISPCIDNVKSDKVTIKNLKYLYNDDSLLYDDDDNDLDLIHDGIDDFNELGRK